MRQFATHGINITCFAWGLRAIPATLNYSLISKPRLRKVHMSSLATAVPALRAAGLVGIWNTNVVAGRSVLDGGAAAMLAGNASLADQPIPMEVALGCTHPDDRDWLFERIRRVRRTGGSFSAEFRVLSEFGEVRWVLNRGTLARDEFGTLHGLGVYIDTTDKHRGPIVSAASLREDNEDPLAVAADRCIEVHRALKRSGRADLRHISQVLLTGIGHALAQRINKSR